MAVDDFGRVMLLDFTHVSGEIFPVGSTSVMYTFADDSYNMAHCNFSVIVDQGKFYYLRVIVII